VRALEVWLSKSRSLLKVAFPYVSKVTDEAAPSRLAL
jgi:hypothetical protein